VRANYLASPPLVVAYALAGTVNQGPRTEPLGIGKDGKPVYLKDIWPTTKEIADLRAPVRHRDDVPRRSTPTCSRATSNWRKIKTDGGETYRWNMGSTYVQNPPYFEGMKKQPEPVTDVVGARILAPVPRQDHHRPHLAGRLDQADLARPASSSSSTRCVPPTSTSTARAAATTK
jgi:aconitate hydratase